MENFTRPIQVRWADLDPNFHLRHSVYYDWAALNRLEFLNEAGLTTSIMQQFNFGPILLREECIFKREIKMEDKVTIDLQLIKSKKDYSRWSIIHTIKKNTVDLSAIITVDGAWIDTIKRKLTVPPEQGIKVFSDMPRHESFQWLE